MDKDWLEFIDEQFPFAHHMLAYQEALQDEHILDYHIYQNELNKDEYYNDLR